MPGGVPGKINIEKPPEVSGWHRAGFERLSQPRAHEYVAEQLRRHMALGLVAEGESFPPERTLARMFGVGRHTIQLALAMLEADRLVESRRGRSGGTFVIGRPRDKEGFKRLVAGLRKDRDKVEEALLFRRMAEEASTRLAAQEATEEELAVLGELSTAMSEAATEYEFHRFDTEFHLQIGRASHNSLLAESVERVRVLLNDAILLQPESELWHERIDAEHQSILDAIIARDALRGADAMTVHLDHSEQGIRAVLAALR